MTVVVMYSCPGFPDHARTKKNEGRTFMKDARLDGRRNATKFSIIWTPMPSMIFISRQTYLKVSVESNRTWRLRESFMRTWTRWTPMGLDHSALQLPGNRRQDTFRVFGFLTVNVQVPPGRVRKIIDSRWPLRRTLADGTQLSFCGSLVVPTSSLNTKTKTRDNL